MKIERNYIRRQTLQEFAEEYDLTLAITERRGYEETSNMRFYAHFKDCEVKEVNMLSGVTGDGSSEGMAVRVYAEAISEKLLVFKAYTTERKEIRVPVLSFAGFTE